MTGPGEPEATGSPVDVPERSRFEAAYPEGTGVLTYVRRGDEVVLQHTVVPVSLEGRGVGSALARAALAWAEREHLAVVPQCTFVQGFLRRHPEEVRVEVRPV